MIDSSWRGQAACRTAPPSWWEVGDENNRIALTICRRYCTVRIECRRNVKPIGIIAGGAAYDDDGHRVPLCRCGRPATAGETDGHPACPTCFMPTETAERYDAIALVLRARAGDLDAVAQLAPHGLRAKDLHRIRFYVHRARRRVRHRVYTLPDINTPDASGHLRSQAMTPSTRKRRWLPSDLVDEAVVERAVDGQRLPRRLSVAERRIAFAKLIDMGLRNKEIARRCGCSADTVYLFRSGRYLRRRTAAA